LNCVPNNVEVAAEARTAENNTTTNTEHPIDIHLRITYLTSDGSYPLYTGEASLCHSAGRGMTPACRRVPLSMAVNERLSPGRNGVADDVEEQFFDGTGRRS